MEPVRCGRLDICAALCPSSGLRHLKGITSTKQMGEILPSTKGSQGKRRLGDIQNILDADVECPHHMLFVFYYACFPSLHPRPRPRRRRPAPAPPPPRRCYLDAAAVPSPLPHPAPPPPPLPNPAPLVTRPYMRDYTMAATASTRGSMHVHRIRIATSAPEHLSEHVLRIRPKWAALDGGAGSSQFFLAADKTSSSCSHASSVLRAEKAFSSIKTIAKPPGDRDRATATEWSDISLVPDRRVRVAASEMPVRAKS
ncbi:hypothetical protein C8J57DRAFT_1213957 [Mycena rebaudengoi]|nr:hypothetical protein C8J57DRAFT_1213957 [Mycena rebaudengoi]